MKYVLFIICILFCVTSNAQASHEMSTNYTDSIINVAATTTDSTFIDINGTNENPITNHLSSFIYPSSSKEIVAEFNKTHRPLNNTYQSYTANPDSSFKKGKVWLIGGSSLLALGGAYVYVNNSWWAGEKRSFHFDGGRGLGRMFDFGRDAIYAQGLDKFGHFYGGLIFAEMFKAGLTRAGMTEKKANILSGVFSTSVQLFIEIKDGYAPDWGFSIYDLMSGSLGAFYPHFQSKSKFLSAVDIKFSYYKHDDFYFRERRKLGVSGSWHDDYMNQTYWFSYSPGRHKPNSKWPKWLAIAAGFGVDNTLNNYIEPNSFKAGRGSYELYIAPDIDFRGLLPKKPFWQKLAKALNFVKVPLPTLRISQDTRFLPLFM